MAETGRPRHVDPTMDRIDPRRAGIRNDDAGSAKDGKPAHNSKAAVQRSFRELLPTGDGDLDLDVLRLAEHFADFPDRFPNHGSWHGIDCRFSRRNRQSGPRYRPDA